MQLQQAVPACVRVRACVGGCVCVCTLWAAVLVSGALASWPRLHCLKAQLILHCLVICRVTLCLTTAGNHRQPQRCELELKITTDVASTPQRCELEMEVLSPSSSANGLGRQQERQLMATHTNLGARSDRWSASPCDFKLLAGLI